MRPSRVVLLLWLILILVLLVLEIAELTHFFSLPVESIIGDPLAVIIAIVFTTILGLVGSIFLGIYFTQRVLNPTGFTPFEEEMLKMRRDVTEMKREIDRMSGRAPNPGTADPAEREERP